MKRIVCSVMVVTAVLISGAGTFAAAPLKALIVDGQNNHKVWPTTTKMMKLYLEESKRFSVDVATAAPQGTDPDFKPDFSSYDVVISNFGHGAAPWPTETQKAFEKYVGEARRVCCCACSR